MRLDELKQGTAHMALVDTDAVINQGRLAYKMGIEKADCPFRDGRERDRKLWLEGYRLEFEKFQAMLRRNEGSLR